MKLQRLYLQPTLRAYFQSFVLWLIAYFTLFIDIKDFTDRFMGSLTGLLVLAALLDSIDTTLPQTSYFKDIDLWLLYLMLNIAAIVFIHIIVDIYQNEENESCNIVCNINFKLQVQHEDPADIKKSVMINQAAKILGLISMVLFITVFFYITAYT